MLKARYSTVNKFYNHVLPNKDHCAPDITWKQKKCYPTCKPEFKKKIMAKKDAQHFLNIKILGLFTK